MFLFQGSQINTVISSFERFREHSKLCAHSQIKAFNSLHNWATDCNNSAIQDVSSKLSDLFAKGDLSQDKNYSLKDIVQMFKRFKELDSKTQQLQLSAKLAKKHEKNSLSDVEKCPTYKNIRDLELKHLKAQADREAAEIKYYNVSKENEASKAILFKTHLKRLNEELKRQNEVERVLLNAMADLIQQIPDISAAPEEDQNEINYGNFDKTHKICSKARKQISRLSLNPEPVQAPASEEEEEEAAELPAAEKPKKETKKKRTRSSRVSCPPNMTVPPLVEEEKKQPDETAGLYPKLDALNISSDWTEVSSICQPPPTYSDSESMSSAGLQNKPPRFFPSYRRVVPSAPSYDEVATEKDTLTKSSSRVKFNLVPGAELAPNLN